MTETSGFDPQRPFSELPLIAFDTETTGLSAASERVVELAAVREENGGRDEFSFLLDPGLPIPPGAQRVHGISNAMVAGKPALEAVLPDFLEFIAGAVLVAHNAPFDIGYLAAGLQRAGLPLIAAPVIDSLELCRALVAGPPNYKLETLARYLRVPPQPAHRALGDATACLEITRRALDGKGLGSAPLQKILNLAKSRPGFLDHDPAGAPLPLTLEPLRRALRERRPVTLAIKAFGVAEEITGIPCAYLRDERNGDSILVRVGEKERPLRLDQIRAATAVA